MIRLISNDSIKPLRELGMEDVGLVGGKNASLGEMISNLANAGVSVPDGYATTANAFWNFLDHNQLRERIQKRLKDLDINDVSQLTKAGKEIRQWIVDAPFQDELQKSIIDAYESMSIGVNSVHRLQFDHLQLQKICPMHRLLANKKPF